MESVKIKDVQFDEKGLIPAIVQDAGSGEVLMMAYVNKESLEKTVETGETWFWSRSRKKLWHKGEESAHFQHVQRIRADCDGDTLVIQVIPDGPACHTNHRSCFYRNLLERNLLEWNDKNDRGNLSILHVLYKEIKDRRRYPVDKSYTNYLQQMGKDKIDKKIGEEAAEVIIADQHEDRKEIIDESCDLLYHLFVLWENAGIDLYDIMEKMEERDGRKGNKKDIGHQDKTF